MSISTLCFSCSFERSGHTWTQFQTQCNLWTRKNKPVSCKLSEAARSKNLFCLCLGLNLSKSMAQPHCCCRLTQAEISGIEDSRCVLRKPRLHEILLIAYDVHLHFVLFMLFWKIWPYLNPIPNPVQPMNTEKTSRSHASYLKRRDQTTFSASVWVSISPNQWRNCTVAAGWHRPR